jgi:hypothetical protein
MKFTSLLSVGAVAIGALLLAADHGTAMTGSPANLLAGEATSLLFPVTCIKVDGKRKCFNKEKHQSKGNDDDDKGKGGKETKTDKETKTVNLIKVQDTCHVFTPGMGGGGCASPLIHRCDKLKDGDEVCCCYKVDDSQPAQ